LISHCVEAIVPLLSVAVAVAVAVAVSETDSPAALLVSATVLLPPVMATTGGTLTGAAMKPESYCPLPTPALFLGNT
jgi:hypothetical protein